MLGHPVQWEEEGWGEPYSINETRFKFFPSQGGTQGPTGLAVELHSQVSPEAIAAIHLELPDGLFLRAVHESEKWHPQTRETADHSMPYTTAVALTYGRVDQGHFDDRYIFDPQLLELTGRVKVERSEEADRRVPEAMLCYVDVVTKSGQKYSAEVPYHKGHYKNPMTDAEVEEKFRSLAKDLLSPDQTDALLEKLWHLEEVEHIGEVIRMTRI
jgi:2-methylcitrate dehydratase